MSASIIILADWKQQHPPPKQRPRTIYDLTLEERQYAEHLPFVSGLPTAFLEGRWP
jgi:hypothetical protein